MLKLHHATINKGVVFFKKKKREERKEETGKNNEGKVFCARWLFCEALALVAVAVVVVCVELVVEVVLKSNFCAGCGFPSMHCAGEGGWYREGF